MKAKNAIIGAAALAAITGCGGGDISMTGDAAYCVRQQAANANEKTVLGIYVDAKLHVNGGDTGFSDISTRVYGSNITPLFQLNYEDFGNLDVNYSVIRESVSIQGLVEDVSIRAMAWYAYEDFPLEEVDCKTLDAMFKQ